MTILAALPLMIILWLFPLAALVVSDFIQTLDELNVLQLVVVVGQKS